MHEDLMLSRRQKTLSSISNYIPLHILLNEPAGITFSITVSKSWTIEQLARQIEAEYAYLVEREIPGGSNYPVIECGALFDHVDFKGSKRSIRGSGGGGGSGPSKRMTLGLHQQQLQPHTQPHQPREQKREQEGCKDDDSPQDSTATASTFTSTTTTTRTSVDCDHIVPQENDHRFVGKDQFFRDDDDEGDDDPVDDNEDEIDHRTEAESRGVQFRFSDRIEDVLDRDSTVHVVNIDQGLGMGRKLSLTNLALAISHEATTSPDTSNPESSTPSTVAAPVAGVAKDIAATPQSSKSPLFSQVFSPNSDIRDTQWPPSEEHLSTYASVPATLLSTSDHGTDSSDNLTPASLLWEQVISESMSEPGTMYDQGPVQDSRISSITGPFVSSPFASSNSLAATAGGESPSMSAIPGRLSTSSHGTMPSRPRSRATDILLNLESSSNDARFQEILHNTIALDHFRQFCFQEYSIENLLFWLDVELFSKGGENLNSSECDPTDQKPDRSRGGLTEGQFAVQHARYIYLTYIDSCGPLQVNLSDETRTEIPWPILDDDHYQPLFAQEAQEAQTTSGASTPVSTAPSSAVTSPMMAPITKKNSRSVSSRRAPGRPGSTTTRFSRQKKRQQGEEDALLLGWPFDRHMFDGAQEHTYQLMKGHTLVRFEESDLWKAVLRIIHERPDDYAKATIKGPLSLYYKPDPAVVLKAVTRSRSRHLPASLQTLYNWNNSTSDLDRSRDKEEALARTMSQYFGPIPPSIRHPGRITIVGLGREDIDDDLEEEDGYFNSFESIAPLSGGITSGGSRGDGLGPSVNSTNTSRRSSLGSVAGARRSRFVKRLSHGIAGRSSANASKRHSIVSDNPPSYYSLDQDPAHPGCHADSDADDMTLDSIENGKRTTRWMVTGYFNDQVRLTAAQRKRLLRRNNKLTKFFGSRVDGTLRPVEERVEDPTPGQSSSQSSVPRAPGTGSTTLAYALSSSTIQDMPLNGKRKQNKQQVQQQQRRPKKSSSKVKHLPQSKLRGEGSGEGGNEVLLFIPDATDRSLTSSSTRSIGLLNKFKKYASADDYGSSSRSNGAGTTTTSGRSSNISGHSRSFTASDAPLHSFASTGQQRKRYAAHPHPLWSGSLSEQEGVSPTIFERRRGLSILSVMDSSLPVDSGVSPTTPTSIAALRLHTSPQGMDPELSVKSPMAVNTEGHQLFSAKGVNGHSSGSTLDRQAMLSRRKKADKLSMFFGAQLTAVELSSQLKMDCGDDEHLMSGPAATLMNGSRVRGRFSTDDSYGKKAFPEATSILTSTSSFHTTRPVSAPAAPKTRTSAITTPLAVAGPTFSSVNQLSTKERTILWKRNKKLRELLGESLPESAVALALTGPILFGNPSSSSIGCRPALRTSASSSRRTSVASVRHLPQIPMVGGGRRSSYSRVIAGQQVRRGSRSSRGSMAGLRRQLSTNSLDSILAMDNLMATMVYRKRVMEQDGYENEGAEDDGLADDDDDDDDFDDAHISLKSPSTLARRRSSLRPIHRSTPSVSSTSSSLFLSRTTPPTISTSVLHPFGLYSASDRTTCSSVPITPNTPITPMTPSPTETMSRFRQKKRMDKIQQFLGDKVPEQDLWMGAVGRERTMAMLELDPLTFQSSSSTSQPLSITTASLSSGSKKMKILGKNRLGGLGDMGGRTSPGALSAPAFSKSGSSKLFERKTTTLPGLVSISAPASTCVSAPASAISSIPSVLSSPTRLDSPSLSRVKELLGRPSEDTIESLGISAADF